MLSNAINSVDPVKKIRYSFQCLFVLVFELFLVAFFIAIIIIRLCRHSIVCKVGDYCSAITSLKKAIISTNTNTAVTTASLPFIFRPGQQVRIYRIHNYPECFTFIMQRLFGIHKIMGPHILFSHKLTKIEMNNIGSKPHDLVDGLTSPGYNPKCI